MNFPRFALRTYVLFSRDKERMTHFALRTYVLFSRDKERMTHLAIAYANSNAYVPKSKTARRKIETHETFQGKEGARVQAFTLFFCGKEVEMGNSSEPTSTGGQLLGTLGVSQFGRRGNESPPFDPNVQMLRSCSGLNRRCAA